MPRLTPEQQLEKAKQDKARAEAKIRSASAKLRAADRRLDTRRKILAGAIILSAAAADPKLEQWFRRRIEGLSERDKAIFTDWKRSDDSAG